MPVGEEDSLSNVCKQTDVGDSWSEGYDITTEKNETVSLLSVFLLHISLWLVYLITLCYFLGHKSHTTSSFDAYRFSFPHGRASQLCTCIR